MGSRSPARRGNFRGKGSPIVKYRDFLPWAVQKWLNRLICHLGFGLGWAKEAQVQSYSPGGANAPTWEGTSAPPGEYDWTIQLWRRCSLTSNYFDHLLQVHTHTHVHTQKLVSNISCKHQPETNASPNSVSNPTNSADPNLTNAKRNPKIGDLSTVDIQSWRICSQLIGNFLTRDYSWYDVHVPIHTHVHTHVYPATVSSYTLTAISWLPALSFFLYLFQTPPFMALNGL